MTSRPVRPWRLAGVIAFVTMALLLSSVSLASRADAVSLSVASDGGFIALEADQPNTSSCVIGVKSAKPKSEGKDKTIVAVDVTFKQTNMCKDVTLRVAAVDTSKRVSQGNLDPFPEGTKGAVHVTMTGNAQKDAEPEFYVLVS